MNNFAYELNHHGILSGVKSTILFLLLFLLPTAQLMASEKTQDNTANFIANYYMDNRDFNTVSLIYSSKSLPYGMTLWGFTDLHSNQNSDDNRSDFTTFFTEARLSKMFKGGWGVQAEYNDSMGNDNDLARFGVIYKLPLKQFVLLRAFPLQTNGSNAQLSLAWRTTVGMEQLFFEGFVDYNIVDGQTNRIVAEPQLRYMLGQRHGVTVEYRLNEFLIPTSSDESGVAVGFYYHF